MKTLMRFGEERRLPGTIRADHGAEFVAWQLNQWAHQNGVRLDICSKLRNQMWPLQEEQVEAIVQVCSVNCRL